MNSNGNQQYSDPETPVVGYREAPAQAIPVPQPSKETPMQFVQGQQVPVQFVQGQQVPVQYVQPVQQYVQVPGQEKCVAGPVAAKHPRGRFARRLLLKVLLGLVILVLILYLYLLLTA